MARIRTIKPDFFNSLTVAKLTPEARLTFIGLWTYVDDHGRGLDEPRLVKAALWALDDNTTIRVVEGHLMELARLGLIVRYAMDGKPCLAVVGWDEHQRISHKTASKLPAPPPLTERRTDSGMAPEDSGMIPEASGAAPPGKERKGKERKGNIPAGPELVVVSGGWPAKARAIYAEHIGDLPVPLFGKHLKDTVDTRGGWEAVEPVWRAYCRWRPYVLPNGKLPEKPEDARRDTRFCGPADFAKTYKQWAELLEPLGQSA